MQMHQPKHAAALASETNRAIQIKLSESKDERTATSRVPHLTFNWRLCLRYIFLQIRPGAGAQLVCES